MPQPAQNSFMFQIWIHFSCWLSYFSTVLLQQQQQQQQQQQKTNAGKVELKGGEKLRIN